MFARLIEISASERLIAHINSLLGQLSFLQRFQCMFAWLQSYHICLPSKKTCFGRQKIQRIVEVNLKKKVNLVISHLYNHPCTVFAFAIRHLTQVKRRRSKKLLQRTKDSSNMDCNYVYCLHIRGKEKFLKSF